MRRLHFLITGLCPDFGTQTEAALADLAVPSLRTLLGRGRTLENRADTSLSRRLAQLFQLDASSELPLAPLRLQADGIDPGDGQWWCADPVHFQLMLDHLRLGGGSQFNLDSEEAAALLASLNGHFAGEVEFLAPSPLHWYARFARPLSAVSTPLDQARGQSVRPSLPQGPDGTVLQRLMNEAQMLLHAHPVNQQREDRGLEPVNSIWFWGGGQRPRVSSLPQTVLADSPPARALARAASATVSPLPQAFVAVPAGTEDCLVVLDSLLPLSCDGRIEPWRQEAIRLEAAWFGPGLAALKRGELKELQLESLGAEAQARHLRPLDAWKFWQGPGHLCPALSR